MRMGTAWSAPTAPVPSIRSVRLASHDNRRRSTSIFFRTNVSSGWGDSSLGTSRGSIVEPRRPSVVIPIKAEESPTVVVDDRERQVGPHERTFSTSNRSLLSGIKRRMSQSALSQIPGSAELRNELRLVKRNFLSNKPWLDGFAVMWIVLYNTLTSVAIAWLVAAVYAVGSPLAPMLSIPRDENRLVFRRESLLFSTAIGAYFVMFASMSYAITKSCILTDRLLATRMTTRYSFRRTFANYLRVAIFRILFAILIGAGVMAAIDLSRVDYQAIGRTQLLVLVFVAGSYIDYAIRHTRGLRQRIIASLGLGTTPANTHALNASIQSNESMGKALDSSAAIVSTPTMSTFRRLSSMSLLPRGGSSRTLLQKLMRSYRGFTIVAIGVMFAFMHLAIALRMNHQWQISIFAAFSLIVKISIQEATKFYFLSPPRKTSARTTHMVMTLPTTLIDAQIRMVFVQFSLANFTSSSSVFTSSFIIVICKILFRLAKIMRLRYVIKSRLSHSRGMHRILRRVNSRITVRDVAVARAEYSHFLDWRNQKLRLHAAEVYADMHGEYISIGLAMAIVFFFTSHPMYALSGVEAQIPQQLVSAVVQLCTGLAFDYLASVVEGIHEVPLYEAIGDEGRSLRVFMHVLLGAITSVNVGIVAVFLFNRPPTT